MQNKDTLVTCICAVLLNGIFAVREILLIFFLIDKLAMMTEDVLNLPF
jgi:hypothetical protein